MATVPRSQLNQVQQASLPGARVSANTSLESFGGGASQEALNSAVVGTAGKLAAIGQEQFNAANDTAVKEKQTNLIKARNDFFAKAQTLKGKNAFEAGTFNDEYQKFIDSQADSLSNGMQKQMFNNVAQSQKLQLDQDLSRHMSIEADRYQKETTETGVQVAQQDAIIHYGNSERIATNVNNMDVLIEDHYSKQGMSPAGIGLLKQAARSQTYLGVMDKHIDGKDFPMAQSLYESVKEEMSPAAREKAEAILKPAKLEHESFNKAKEIIGKSGLGAGALKAAYDIEDPELRKETTSKIRDRIEIGKAQQEQNERAQFKGITNYIRDNKALPPESMMRNMPLENQIKAKEMYKSLMKGDDPETDMGTYHELSQMAASNPSKFANTNLDGYYTKLSKADAKKFTDLQTKVAADGATGGFGSQQDIVNKTLMENGIAVNPKDTERKKKIGQFYRQFRERVEALGAKPTDKDVQAIADNLLTETITDKGWFVDTKRRAFEVTIDDIPEAERKVIETSIKRAGGDVTPERITDLYRRGLNAK